MLIARTIADIRAAVSGYRANGETIALVPTMGYLHDGHMSLVRQAGHEADRVVAGKRMEDYVQAHRWAPEDLVLHDGGRQIDVGDHGRGDVPIGCVVR